MQWLYSLDNINEVANSFWQELGSDRIVALHGPMGAGKTTFIHALCDSRGVKDVVGSPTFAIINEYIFENKTGQDKIFHIDLYRLKDEDEAIQAGVEDCLYSDHICLVEWPEKAPGLFPNNTVHVYIELVDTKTRRLRIGNN